MDELIEELKSPTWTAPGYPRLAKLMDYDRDVAIFRRFGSLNMLNILKLQAELIDLEGQYELACKVDVASGKNDEFTLSMSFESLSKANSNQKALLDQIGTKLKHYNECLLQIAQIDALPTPKKSNYRFLGEWLIGEEEGKNFLQGLERFTWKSKGSEDPESFRKREILTISKNSRLLQPWFVEVYHQVYGGRGQNRKVVDPELGRIVDYTTKGSRVVNLMTMAGDLIGVILASVLPVIAVAALYAVKDPWKRIGLSISFSTLFGLALHLFTSATVKEKFAATTALAVVEVVFIGTVNS